MPKAAARPTDQSHSSVLFWVFAIFIMWIPLLNMVMALYWAFSGENQTRKNYFRALIIWFLLGIGLWFLMMLVGLAPLIIDLIDQIGAESTP